MERNSPVIQNGKRHSSGSDIDNPDERVNYRDSYECVAMELKPAAKLSTPERDYVTLEADDERQVNGACDEARGACSEDEYSTCQADDIRENSAEESETDEIALDNRSTECKIYILDELEVIEQDNANKSESDACLSEEDRNGAEQVTVEITKIILPALEDNTLEDITLDEEGSDNENNRSESAPPETAMDNPQMVGNYEHSSHTSIDMELSAQGKPEDVNEPIPRVPQNGDCLAYIRSQECYACRGSNIQPEEVPECLLQLQMPLEDYSSALDILAKDPKLQYHTWVYNKWLQAAMLIAIFMAIWLMGIGIWHRGGLPDRLGIGLFFVLAWLFSLTVHLICHFSRYSMNKHARISISKANDILIKNHIILGMDESGAGSCNKINIYFIYFEAGPCLEQLVSDLTKCEQQENGRGVIHILERNRREIQDSPSIVIDDTDCMIPEGEITELQRQTLAKDLLLHYTSTYVRNLVSKKLPKPAHRRHARRLPCLCQYVQRHHFKMYDVMES